MLNRIQIIQRLIRATGTKTYVEIGVNRGACFLRVKAPVKLAVDPSFKISLGRRLKYLLKNPGNYNNRYYEQTSDRFFAEGNEILKNSPPEVVFIDGLHTYEQSLRDVVNSLQIVRKGGFILMHDCNPVSEAAAYPGESIDYVKKHLPTYKGVWNGDVWKAIVHLRSLHHDLEVCVLDCDHGIGVVRRGRPQETLDFSQDQIRDMAYADLQANREKFLNLKSPEFFEDILASVTGGTGRSHPVTL